MGCILVSHTPPGPLHHGSLIDGMLGQGSAHMDLPAPWPHWAPSLLCVSLRKATSVLDFPYFSQRMVEMLASWV